MTRYAVGMKILTVLVGGVFGVQVLGQGFTTWTNGTWNVNADGSWETPGNWQGGWIASGVGATGNFRNIDITANRIVTVNDLITVGYLEFADLGGGGSHPWFVTNAAGGALRLEVNTGIPLIWVTNQGVHLGVTLEGTQGFRKFGAGNLYMRNTNNTITGPIVVEGGFHQILSEFVYGPVPAVPTPNAVTYSNLTVQNWDSFVTYSTNRGITLAGGTTWFRVGWGKQTVIESPVTGPGNLGVTYDGSYLLLRNQANDYSGTTYVGGGGSWWDNEASVARLRLGNTEVIPHGPGKGDVVITNRTVTDLRHTGWLEMNGFNETINGLWGNGFITNNVGTPVVLTMGAGNSSGVFTGTIDEGPGGAISVVKIGKGVQFLGGTNLWNGLTTVEAGTLGLGGAGSLGDVIFKSGTTLSVGLTNLGQVLTVGGVLGLTNATVRMNLGSSTMPGAGDNDLINANVLHLDGQIRLRIEPLRPLVTGTPYVLATYGTIVGNPALVEVSVPGTRYQGSLDLTQPGQIRWSVSGAEAHLTWAGMSTRWDLTNSWTWSDAGLPAQFYNMDRVTFNDTQRGGYVSIGTQVRPGALTVSGTNSYTWLGLGGVDGNLDLVKQGSGVLMIGTTNTFAGAVVVNGGTLVTIIPEALGLSTNPVTIASGATWDLRGGTHQFRVVTVSGDGVDGQGAIVNHGGANLNALRFLVLAGDVTLGGYNRWDVRNNQGPGYVTSLNQRVTITKVGPAQVSFVNVAVDPAIGDIFVKEGGFAIEGTSAGGDPADRLIVSSNAFFQLWGTAPFSKQFVFMGGSRLYTGSGGENNNHLNGSIVLSNGITAVDVTSGNQWNFSAPVSGDGGLVTINAGILRINNPVDIGGPLIAQNGVLVLQSNGVVNGASALVVRDAGRLLIDDGRVDLSDRVADSVPIALAGGELNYRGATNVISTETLGTLSVLGGVTRLNMERGPGSSGLQLTFSGVNRQQGIVNFVATGGGNLGGTGTDSARVYLSGYANNSIVPWGTVNGTNFAWYTSDYGITTMVPPSVEFDGGADQSGIHVKFTPGNNNYLLDDDRSVASLTITPAGTEQYIDVYGSVLTIESGGVLQNGNTVFSFRDTTTGGRIEGPNLLFNVVNATATMRVEAVVGGTEFSKEGAGWMILLADAANTGPTRIGGGTLQLGQNNAQGMVGAGDVVNYGRLLFDRTDNLTFANNIIGYGSLWKTNANVLKLTGNNTYTGVTMIGQGVIEVERITDGPDSQLGVAKLERPSDSFVQIINGTLRVTGSSTSQTIRAMWVDRGVGMTVDVAHADGVLRWDGQVQGSGSLWLDKVGPGTLILGGVQDNVNLQLRVNSGTVLLDKQLFANARAAANLTMLNDAQVRLIGNGGDQIYGTLTMEGTAQLDLNGHDEAINVLQGGGGTIRNDAAGTVAVLTVGRNNGSGHFGGTISDGLGAVALHKTGTGELRLTNDFNTYSGGTVISNGSLFVHSDGSLGALPASSQADNIIVYGGRIQNQDSDTVLHANRGIMVLGTNLVLRAGWNKTLTVMGNISGPGGVTINDPSDSGVVLLGGSNTFGGNLVLPTTGSRLTLLSPHAIPYGIGRGGVVTRHYINLNGNDARVNWMEGAWYARVVNSNGAAVTLTIGEDNSDTRYWAGLLHESSGSIALRKVGTGTAVLQAVGTNTLTGGISVLGGVLALDSAEYSTIGVADADQAGPVELRLVNRFGNVTVTNKGTVVLGATYAGGTITLQNGVLRLTGAGLYEGRLTGSNNQTDPNPATSIRLGTAYAHTRESQLLFPDNSTYVYTGYLYVPGDEPVTWSFAKNFDDNMLLKIDGTTWINHTTWSQLFVTNVTLTPGYHTFELRLGQGGGGVGPNIANWVWGFAVDPQGRGSTNPEFYIPLVDMGDGQTFVVSTSSYTVANALDLSGVSQVVLEGPARPVFTNQVNLAGTVRVMGPAGRRLDWAGPVQIAASGVQMDVDSNLLVRVDGVISGPGGFTKGGSGAMEWSAANTFAGDTRVLAGTLRLVGNGSFGLSPSIRIDEGAILDVSGRTGQSLTLSSGQTLQGSGTLVGGLILESGAMLRPGSSPGALTVVGDVTFNAGSTFEVEILGPLSGQYDQLLMEPLYELTLGGATLSVVAPNALPLGTVFPVISGWGSLDSTTFDGLPNAAVFSAGANQFQIHYGTLTGYEDDVTLTVVPEPGTLATLSLALAVGAILRRRMRRSILGTAQ